ncbi:hypothetical protein DYU11_02475 [Fibrisoma montanum]|uniref:Uncharacterized protein n=1 Tax=Fibrisoma montanum TaxID=2305895 RepID=A0A418MIF5_9BACT|nr:hypothetical protein [Fibrisoma montanum]RIV27197.1 hypothetical protein DYU11_02475 [Fibrisoma montanum]
MTTDQHIESKKKTPKTRLGLNPIVVLYGVIILLVVGIGYLFYRNWQLTKQLENERTTLLSTAWQNQIVNDRQQLTFAMKTFVWAVRNAMLQNKPGEINEYFNTLVRNEGVREVLLVDQTGKVTISTNKKNQGIKFASRFPAYLLNQQDVYFNNKIPYELSAPVTGPNQRLGTLVMFYKPTPVLPNSVETP